MGFKSALKKGLGSGLSPKKWMGYDQVKSDTKTLGNLFRCVVSRSKDGQQKKETFQEAVQRYGLSEADIQKKMKTSKDLVAIFLVLGGLLFVYALYQWVGVHLINGFICCILSFLTFTYAFKEHFNLFQMRQRRLGCTYKEWVKHTFKGSK